MQTVEDHKADAMPGHFKPAKPAAAAAIREMVFRHALWLADHQEPGAARLVVRGAELSGADLRCADLWFADFRGADLSGASFRHSKLRDAQFQNATLTGCDLRNCDLFKANFRGAVGLKVGAGALQSAGAVF